MGDRPFTDVVYGNRNGFLTILTEPLSLVEEPFIVRQVSFLSFLFCFSVFCALFCFCFLFFSFYALKHLIERSEQKRFRMQTLGKYLDISLVSYCERSLLQKIFVSEIEP